MNKSFIEHFAEMIWPHASIRFDGFAIDKIYWFVRISNMCIYKNTTKYIKIKLNNNNLWNIGGQIENQWIQPKTELKVLHQSSHRTSYNTRRTSNEKAIKGKETHCCVYISRFVIIVSDIINILDSDKILS